MAKTETTPTPLMSRRDTIAALALTKLVSLEWLKDEEGHGKYGPLNKESVAQACVQYADALIVELDK